MKETSSREPFAITRLIHMDTRLYPFYERRSITVGKTAASFSLIALAKAEARLNLKSFDFDCFATQIGKPSEEQGSWKTTTIKSYAPKPFDTISILAGRSDWNSQIYLKVVLNAIKENFNEIDDQDKKMFGLNLRTSKSITHFDLLEIGLFGKIVSYNLSPLEMVRRNTALSEIYAKIKENPEIVTNHPDSRQPETHYEKFLSDIKEKTVECIELLHKGRLVVSFDEEKMATLKALDAPNDNAFIKNIENAIELYNKGTFRFFSRQSAESKALLEGLKGAVSNKNQTDEQKVGAILDALSNNKAKKVSRLTEILKNQGILSSSGGSMYHNIEQSNNIKPNLI